MAPVQRSVIERLRACVDLMAIVSGVWDAVPVKATLPYIVYVSAVETPNLYFGQNGHLTDVTLQLYSDDGSSTRAGRGNAGFITSYEITEIVLRELTDVDTPLVVDGHDLVDLSLIGVYVTREGNDKESRITEIAFTAELEDVIDA